MALALADIVAVQTTPEVFDNTADRVFNLPTAGVSTGDIMVLCLAINQGGADVGDVLTDPTDWNEAHTTILPNTASTPRMYTYWREVPGGGLGSTITIVSSVTAISHGAVAFAVTNVDTSALDVVGTASTGTSTTLSCPAVTATNTGGLTIRFGCNDDDDQSTQPSMSSHTAQGFEQVGNTVQNGFNVYVWAALQPSTSVGAATCSISNEQWGGMTFVIAEGEASTTVEPTEGTITVAGERAGADARSIYLNTSATIADAVAQTWDTWTPTLISLGAIDATGLGDGAAFMAVRTRAGLLSNWFSVTLGAASTTVEPTEGVVTIQAAAPDLWMTVVPGEGVVAIDAGQPTVETETTVAPTEGLITVQGQQPAIETETTVAPTTGLIAVQGQQPSLVVEVTVGPTAGLITIQGQQPALDTGALAEVTPTEGTVTVQGQVATILTETTVAPTEGLVTVSGGVPTLRIALETTAGLITVTTEAPIVQTDAVTTIAPTVGLITVQGQQPVIGTEVTVQPTEGLITIQGQQPVLAEIEATVAPASGLITVSGGIPTLEGVGVVETVIPIAGLVTVDGEQPTLQVEFTITPTEGTISIDAGQPQVSNIRAPTEGTVTVQGGQPTVQLGLTIEPATGIVTLQFGQPGLQLRLQPVAGLISLETGSPQVSNIRTPIAGSIAIQGGQPVVNAIFEPISGLITVEGGQPSIPEIRVMPGELVISIVGGSVTIAATGYYVCAEPASDTWSTTVTASTAWTTDADATATWATAPSASASWEPQTGSDATWVS